ncbi:hypothetical protein AQUCO_00200623v1 [Aquilegia coerulea]|uniref:Defective in cullin neddylation protein n=1 Tax=Aquilegia coerulea TaxID=218851 RepID=A0A2G5F453_AQUCA|nr:hypothetical protein AQUCO_00200623v1 [Aquilegia coerulea]
MNSSSSSSCTSNFIDIVEIYRRYCDIRSRKDDQNPKEALTQLLKLVELRGQACLRYNDLSKLMSYLDLVDSARFACFYDFVFFMCRENGQKNITLEKAIEAWKLVLKGRFRLLNEWCNFVEKHQRHNVSEDTWQQVLAFSRCVHEDLEGYDPKGAWPVLIDDFVDHMHRCESVKCFSFFFPPDQTAESPYPIVVARAFIIVAVAMKILKLKNVDRTMVSLG